MPSFEIAIIVGVLLLLSVLASRASSKLGIPALALFLIIGMFAGSEGVGNIEFDRPDLALSLGTLALIFILFAGGLDSNIRQLRKVAVPGLALASFGTILTSVAIGYFSYQFLGFTFIEGMLLGAIVSSTDAAAVFSVLRARRAKLKHNMTPLLELESGTNDPTAIFLTFAVAHSILDIGGGPLTLIPAFLLQMFIGAVVGGLLGLLTAWFINAIRLDYDGLYNVLTIGAALVTYGLSELLTGNGFLAVYVCGLMLSRQKFVHKISLTNFHDGLAWIMQIMMFLMLGLLVFPSQLREVAVPGIALALFLCFIARPLAVAIVLAPLRIYTWKEIIFIGWVGLRGAVPIILAMIPLTLGIDGANRMFNLVFFVVLISVALQGTTIRRLSKVLGIAVLKDQEDEEEEVIEGKPARQNLIEITIDENSPVANRQIVDLDLPVTAMILLLTRANHSFIPRGNSHLRPGDRLLVASRRADSDELKILFNGPSRPTIFREDIEE